jgi:hypothetical protein
LAPLGTVDRREALELAESRAAHQPIGALGVVRARLPRRRTGFLFDDRQAAVAQLGLLRARSRDANLLFQAVGFALALVAALRVARAHLPLGTIGVVEAISFFFELADVERPVARDAA